MTETGFPGNPKNAHLFILPYARGLPGEDIRKNQVVLTKGKRINEIDIGILASLGITTVPVFKMPLIGFVSTGDELVSIKKKIKKNQVYDSNRYLLHGLLRKYPVEVKDYGVVKDKLSSIVKKYRTAKSNIKS